jgi:hypothetical protein
MASINPSQLIAMFDKHAIKRGGDVYFEVSAVHSLITSCKDHGFAIIGIEGFKKRNGSIVPSLDLIADLSDYKSHDWQDYKEKVNQAAERFVRGIKESDVLLNFVIIDYPEWALGHKK